MSNHPITIEPSVKIGVALGSGAARGLSHIGVLQELKEIGLKADIIVGSSIGALVGAAEASGHLDALESWLRTMTSRDVFRYFNLRPMIRGGVGDARTLIDELRRRFGSPDIDSLGMPFAAVGTDYETGRELWMQHGDLWDAVRCSIAIPGLVTPALYDRRWVIDGGLVNPVPISVCRALGADLIIAVNLNDDLSGRRQAYIGRKVQEPNAAQDAEEPGWMDRITSGLRARTPSTILDWLDSGAQPLDTPSPSDEEPPGIFSVMNNAINIMQDRITRSRIAGEPADVIIAPRLANMGLLDFDSADHAISEGRTAVRRMLPLIRYALGGDHEDHPGAP